jgi:alpha-ketoglutarate-dependent taurine dioxygenase
MSGPASAKGAVDRMTVAPLFASAESHPVMITPGADRSLAGLRAHLAADRSLTDALLLKHGGLLFRGFDLHGADDFRACAESAGATPYGYVGGNTPRTNVAVDIFTSTEYPATEVIGLHNEMSYLPDWPRRLFFYSLIPASQGGQTSLASSRDVLRALPAAIVTKLRDKRITYIRHFHPSLPVGKSWQATYQTQDRDAVTAIVSAQGSTCAWLPGDVLRVTTTCDALKAHPVTGEEVWFNQAEQWHPSSLDPAMREMCEELVGKAQMPHDCAYGDGEPFDENVLTEVRRALDRSKLLFDWMPHDLLMLDNVFMMHGREAFKGERKTLAYLSAT